MFFILRLHCSSVITVALTLLTRYIYSWEEDIPSSGYLYNAVSHGVLSVPRIYGTAYPATTNTLIISNNKDIPIKVYPKRVFHDRYIYAIRFSDEIVPRKKVFTKKHYALTVSPRRNTLIKHEHNSASSHLQHFELRPSKKYNGYFQIVYNEKCAVPSRHNYLFLTECTSDEERDGIMPHKQLFRIEKDEEQPTFYMKKGLSSNYFENVPTEARTYPDLLAGEAILLSERSYKKLQCKRCSDLCKKLC